VKVVLWNTSYLKAVGGAEKIVHDLASELDARGVKTLIVADKPVPPVARTAAFSPSSPTIEVYADDLSYPFSLKQGIFKSARQTICYLRATRRMYSLFRRHAVDIIHLHYVNFDVFLLMLYRSMFRCRLVLTFTGGDLALAEKNWLARLRIALAMRGADAATVVSRDMAERLGRLFGRPVHIIPNGVRVRGGELALSDQGSEFQAGHFVYCGRLASVKRVHFLVRAFHRCVMDGCPKKLYIIGQGEDALSLGHLIAELALEDRVFLMGGLPHAQALELIRQSLCLVLVSASEGLPLVVLEAMALEKPVISSNVGGVPEIVTDGVDGWLFPADRPDSLCRLIMELSANEEKARLAGKAAAKTIAERFSLERMGLDYITLYEKLLASRTR
jgi:glycosyltransferase involved in cell wall biosynthesis